MAKSLMKEASLEENKLKNENDRLKQRQMLKEDEIKDLREKKLKLELEIKETKQREQMVSSVWPYSFSSFALWAYFSIYCKLWELWNGVV